MEPGYSFRVYHNLEVFHSSSSCHLPMEPDHGCHILNFYHVAKLFCEYHHQYCMALHLYLFEQVIDFYPLLKLIFTVQRNLRQYMGKELNELVPIYCMVGVLMDPMMSMDLYHLDRLELMKVIHLVDSLSNLHQPMDVEFYPIFQSYCMVEVNHSSNLHAMGILFMKVLLLHHFGSLLQH